MSAADRPDDAGAAELARTQRETDRAARVRVELQQARHLLQQALEEAGGSFVPGALIAAVEHLVVAVDDLAAVVGIPPAADEGAPRTTADGE